MFEFFGMNIGSYPQPSPFCDFDIVPSSFPLKDSKIFLSQYVIIEINFAFLFSFKIFRRPSFPIVLKTYDEYGPGKPSSELMNRPSSSIIIGFLCS